mgnify:CR=1 FL=1
MSLYREVAVENFKETEKGVSFHGIRTGRRTVYSGTGTGVANMEVLIDGESAGKMTTNLSGKLSVSIELNPDENASVNVVKC